MGRKHGLSVNGDIAVNRDQQVAAAVDYPCFKQIGLFGIHLDGNAGHFHFELFGRDHVDGRKNGACPKGRVIALPEGFDPVFRHAAVCQHPGYVLFGEHQGFVVPVLLFNQAGNDFVHFLYHVQGTFGAQALNEQRLEVFRLLRRGHLRLDIESGLQEIRVRVVAVPAEEEDRVDVGSAAFIKREQESEGRGAGQPFRRAFMEDAVGGNISQRRLVLFHGADSAENVAESAVGIFVVDLSVHVAFPDVQIVMHQKNQPVFGILGVFDRLHIRMFRPDPGDQAGEKRLQSFLIVKRRVSDPEEKVVVFSRKRDGSQRLSDLSGENLFENGHVLFVFLLVQ